MSRMRAFLAGALLASLLVTAGCPRCPETLVGREVLFEQHNTNAEQLRTLWAVADIEIRLDRRGLYRTIRIPDGRVYFRRADDDPLRPQHFMLRGKEMDQELFRLGIDARADVFYYWIDVPEYARFARLGRLDDAERGLLEGIPLNPVDLLSLLGVLPWPTDPAAPTQVVLKTPDQPCVYQMLVVSRRDAWDGWYLTREMWLDRREEPPRPRQVWLYDRQGQVAMTAELNDYEPVYTGSRPGPVPVIPTDIRIRWPDSEPVRGIRLRLRGASVETEAQPVPPAAAFRAVIPPHIHDVEHIGFGR